MIRISIILAFSLIFVGCGIRFNSTYVKPERKGDLTLPYMSPVILEFKKNGRCIKTSRHMGSDSGPVKYQTLGNYSISHDTIQVEFIWYRSSLSGEDIDIQDWYDLEKPYTTLYQFNQKKDTLTVLIIKGQPGAKYILESK